MLPGMTDAPAGDFLLRIARDAELRQAVYDHLREYCHQCRNRLNSLKLSIYLAMKQSPRPSAENWSEIDRQYRELESRVDLIQFLCRPLVLTRVTLGIDLLVEDRQDAWSRSMAAEGRSLEVVPPAQRAVASFDVDGMGRALDALVAWRSADASASRSAELRWWVEGDRAHVTWDEPSPPTRRKVDRPSGSPPGWTLPLLARIILAHDGDYRLETDRGWRLDVTWPTCTSKP